MEDFQQIIYGSLQRTFLINYYEIFNRSTRNEYSKGVFHKTLLFI